MHPLHPLATPMLSVVSNSHQFTIHPPNVMILTKRSPLILQIYPNRSSFPSITICTGSIFDPDRFLTITRNTIGVQKVHRPTQLTTRCPHHMLSLFNTVSCNCNALSPGFLQSCHSIVAVVLARGLSQPFVVQVTSSSSKTLGPFMIFSV